MKNFKLIALLAGTAMLMTGAAAQAEGRHGGHHGGRGGPGEHGMMMLRAADANGDNSITRAEVEALQAEMFDWMDRNGDGFLDEADESPMRARMRAIHAETRAERAEARAERTSDDDGQREGRGWRHRRGGPDGGRGPMGADADEDGRISREEFLAREDRMFARFDADENGVVTPEELDAAVERRQDRRFWWRD